VASLLVGILAPVVAPFGYDDQDLARRLQPPRWTSWSSPSLLGTDPLGRDVWSRMVYGARTSLLLAGSAVLLASVLGSVLGLVSGYVGGRVDEGVMAATEIQLSFPYLLFAIAFMALLRPSVTNLLIVLVLRSWVVYVRLIRVSVLSMKEREFVNVAVALGASDSRVLFRHIAPNVVTPAIIVSTFQFAELIIVEASLSFLGLGIQPPLPSWGSMLGESREYLFDAWWLVAFPGAAIMAVVLGANLVGDGIRDWLDPRAQRLGV
jgi:peptide/nickel transport system permease protein